MQEKPQQDLRPGALRSHPRGAGSDRSRPLRPDEVTNLCNTASEPNDTPGPDGLSDIDHFARFVRATEAPARDAQLAQTQQARLGAELFDKVGCDICHVQTLATASIGTKVNGGTFTIPPA